VLRIPHTLNHTRGTKSGAKLPERQSQTNQTNTVKRVQQSMFVIAALAISLPLSARSISRQIHPGDTVVVTSTDGKLSVVQDRDNHVTITCAAPAAASDDR
jgi:hypothetical protein